MKLLNLIFLAIFCSINVQAQVKTKYALIIAISDYDPATGWTKLSSHNDIELIETALKKQEFKAENIVIVKKVNAAGIIDAFQQLKNRVKIGDIVVIHYSGHGVQLQDDGNDEIDFLDEALVPLEAIYDINDEEGKKYFRDDDLGDWIFQIRQKLGTDGHLLLSLDSCHSGSGTRGDEKVRGGKPPMVKPNFKTATKSQNPTQSIVDEPVKSRGGSSGSLSKFVLFAGASSDESNFETNANGKSVGSLSYAFSKVLNQLNSDDTYRQVFARIRAEMAVTAKKQTPILEGDIDYRFFSGQFVKQEPYFELTKRVVDAKTEYQLGAGLVAGINVGDKFGVFSAGTSSIKNMQPKFEFEVTDVDYFTSEIKFTKPVPVDFNPAQYWAFRTQQSFANSQIKLALDLKDLSPVSTKTLTDSLKKWSFLKVVLASEQPDILLKNTEKPSLITANDADANLPYLDMKPLDFTANEGMKALKKVLLSYAQTRFLRSVKLTSEDINVSLKLIRVKAKVERGSFKVLEKKFTEIDTLSRRFNENDQFLIQLINKGTVPAYYAIISIQPDDKINPIIPNENDTEIKSYVIKAGETLLLEKQLLNGFSAPFGTEVIKVFATPQPINLSPIILSQGEVATKRGSEDENPLENMLTDFYSNTRGPRTVQAKQGVGSTFEYVYTIIPTNN